MEQKFNVESDMKKKRTSLRVILNQHFTECEEALASGDKFKIRGALLKLEDKKSRLDKIDSDLDLTLIHQLDQSKYNEEMKEIENYHDQCLLFTDQLKEALYSSGLPDNHRSMDNFTDESASQAGLGVSACSKRRSLVESDRKSRTSENGNKKMRQEVVIDDADEIMISDDDDEGLKKKGRNGRNLKQEVNVADFIVKGEDNIEQDIKSEVSQQNVTNGNDNSMESGNLMNATNDNNLSDLGNNHNLTEIGNDNLIVSNFETEETVHNESSSPLDHNYARNNANAMDEVLNNEEILLQILNNLEIPNLIVIERVCKKWRKVSLESWRTVHSIDIYETFKIKKFELYHLEEILRRAGKYLTHLDCSYLRSNDEEIASGQDLPAKTSLEIINSYCDKLTSLCLNFTWNEENYLNYLDVNILKNLKSLTVGSEKFHDENLPTVLENAINLEKFSIAGYDYNENKLLKLSQKCKTLSVFGSRKFSNEMLEKVLRTHPNIQNLDISDTDITPIALFGFEKQFTALALLGAENFFQNFAVFKNFLNFINLKILDISLNVRIDRYITGDRFLLTIVENCQMLEELRLRKVTGIPANDFKHLENLKQLMYLDVSSTKITGPVLIDLAKKLKKFQQLFCYGCNYISGTAINEIIDNSPELRYLAISSTKLSKKMIKLSVASLLKRTNNISLIISLRSDQVKNIPAQVKKLKLKDGIKNYSKSSILRVVCGLEDHCGCDFSAPCICFECEEILVSFS